MMQITFIWGMFPPYSFIDLRVRMPAPKRHRLEGWYLIRLEEEDSRNITIVSRVSISLGKMTADDTEMYVRVNDSDTVARVESEWGNYLLSLFTEPAPVSQP